MIPVEDQWWRTSGLKTTCYQWPFQVPKLEVPTIEKRPIFQASISGNIPTIHMAKNMVHLRTPILGSCRSPIKPLSLLRPPERPLMSEDRRARSQRSAVGRRFGTRGHCSIDEGWDGPRSPTMGLLISGCCLVVTGTMGLYTIFIVVNDA